MSVLINLLGLGLMGLIVWWFWLWKPRSAVKASRGLVTIVVDQGVYDPSHVELPVGKTTILRFIRKDPSPCAEMVLIDALDISVELPLERPKDVAVAPTQPGRYNFTCQMQMYRGELIVR